VIKNVYYILNHFVNNKIIKLLLLLTFKLKIKWIIIFKWWIKICRYH